MTLVLALVSVWLGVLAYQPRLQVIACDVGQGDATLITQGGNQILIDGGPNEAVLSCLGNYMPFWDRKIELIVLTHPQADHYQGLIAVTSRYNLDTVVLPEADSGSQDYQVLIKQVGGSAKRVIMAQGAVNTRLGLIYLDIFGLTYQNEKQTAFQSPKNPNDSSLISRLKYGQFTALFTGDATPKLLANLIAQGFIGQETYLKVPHHGSKNGLSEAALGVIKPEIATISVGVKNSYGHPHREVLDLLNKYQVKYFRTDEKGDVRVFSDGKTYWLSN